MEKTQILSFTTSSTPPLNMGCEYGIQGKRPSMEDASIYACWICKPLYKKCVIVHLFGIFDGHGGKEASKFASQSLPAMIARQFAHISLSSTVQVKKALIEAFEGMQRYMQIFESKRYQTQGTTAVVIVRINNHLYCANVGDSRAVLCAGNDVFDLSKDHKPSSPEEMKRIHNLGGYVNPPSRQDVSRVWESPQMQLVGLSTSRSIGDLESRTPFGKYLVSPTPEVTVNILQKDQKGFIILACDGVWDVTTSFQACKVADQAIRKHANPCKAIVNYAYKKGSTDNISAMVIKL